MILGEGKSRLVVGAVARGGSAIGVRVQAREGDGESDDRAVDRVPTFVGRLGYGQTSRRWCMRLYMSGGLVATDGATSGRSSTHPGNA